MDLFLDPMRMVTPSHTFLYDELSHKRLGRYIFANEKVSCKLNWKYFVELQMNLVNTKYKSIWTRVVFLEYLCRPWIFINGWNAFRTEKLSIGCQKCLEKCSLKESIFHRHMQ